MNTQTQNKTGLANNLALQMGLLIVAAIFVIAIAWKYLW